MSLPKVNIFNYTAAANPYFVKSLAHKYGYEFDKDQKLDTVLQQLVTYEGEPVMIEIIENSPDKDLFMDYFGLKNIADLPQLKDFITETNKIGEQQD